MAESIKDRMQCELAQARPERSTQDAGQKAQSQQGKQPTRRSWKTQPSELVRNDTTETPQQAAAMGQAAETIIAVEGAGSDSAGSRAQEATRGGEGTVQERM